MSQNNDLSGFEKLFLALCDRTRLRLLSLMADGPVSVGYLAEKLGESQPKTSRHLAYLRSVGLVSTAREGKWVYYGVERHLDPPVHDILAATLRGIRGPAVQVESDNAGESKVLSADLNDNQWEPLQSDWTPNEIDVHLL